MRLSIRTNFPDVQRQLDDARKQVRDVATARALNAVVLQARTAMSREIRQEYAVSAAFVRDRLTIRRATIKAGAFDLSAELRGSSERGKRRGANLIAFSAKQTSKGVTVRIKKSGGRKLIRNAFIGNKGRTVFGRVDGTTMASRAKYRGTKHAQKIRGVDTIGLEQMFTTRRVNSNVLKVIRDKFPAIVQRELAFALSQALKG